MSYDTATHGRIPYQWLVLRAWQISLQSPSLWLLGLLASFSVGTANLNSPVTDTVRTLTSYIRPLSLFALLIVLWVLARTISEATIILNVGGRIRNAPAGLTHCLHTACRRLLQLICLNASFTVALLLFLLLVLSANSAVEAMSQGVRTPLRVLLYASSLTVLLFGSVLSFFARQEVILYARSWSEALIQALRLLWRSKANSSFMLLIDFALRLVFLFFTASIVLLVLLTEGTPVILIPAASSVIIILGIRAILTYALWILYYELVHYRTGHKTTHPHPMPSP